MAARNNESLARTNKLIEKHRNAQVHNSNGSRSVSLGSINPTLSSSNGFLKEMSPVAIVETPPSPFLKRSIHGGFDGQEVVVGEPPLVVSCETGKKEKSEKNLAPKLKKTPKIV